jgi:hypothetical protein
MPDRLSASSASKHIACHASAQLDLAIPNWVPPVVDETANNAANRGTAMHANFADLMSLPAGDVENFSAALAYTAEVRRRRRFSVLIEQEVTADWLQSAPSTTADLVLYTQDELHILDLKTGKIPVAPELHSQLLYYAACYGHLAPKAKGAYLHIVQPWAGIMREWFAPAAEIQRFMQDAIAAEAAILGGSTAFSPGDHCTFCAANPHGRGAKGYPKCPAMMALHYPTSNDEVAILSLED